MIGVAYHQTAPAPTGGPTEAFEHFLRRYDDPAVRSTVRAQLQQMADKGVTHISTRLWYPIDGASTIAFGPPYTANWQSKLSQYVADVGSITSRVDGHRLTLYLISVPDMRASIVKGLKTPVGKCARDLKW